MLKKLREWIDEKHYGSVSSMLLEYGLYLLFAVAIGLLASMALHAL